MLIILFVLQFLFANATDSGYSKAIRLFESAQQEYIAGNYEKMHELLLESLRTYSQDPILNQKIAMFAKYYYSITPSILKQPIADFAITLGIERFKLQDKPTQFAFTMSCRSLLSNQPTEIAVTLPNGEEKIVVGPDTETDNYPSTSFPGKYVVRSSSARFPGPLVTGTYIWKLKLKDGRKIEYAIIIAPDNREDQVPKLTLDSVNKKLKWTIAPSLSIGASDDPTFIPYRSGLLTMFEGNSYRPKKVEVINITTNDIVEGQIPIAENRDISRYILNTWEAISKDGDLNLITETTYELFTPQSTK